MDKENESRIDQSMVVKGVVECRGRLVLEGVLEGRVSGGLLKIAETGRLTGEVCNDEIECAGYLQGDILTESLIMRSTGCHVGTAETRRLAVDPGAVLDCVLQSGASVTERPAETESEASGPKFELSQVLTAFQEEIRPCCMDIPWSARLELFNQILALLQKGKPLIRVIGETGSGKTVLSVKLSRNPPAGYEFINMTRRADSLADLLQGLAGALAVAGAESLTQTDLLARVKAALDDRRGRGLRMVLQVDEAEAMDPAVVEGAARFLTNAFEGDEMLQIILFGTAKMEESMTAALAEYFADETNCQLRLAPLSVKDTADYLRFCLQLAAAGNGSASLAFLPYETIRTLHVLGRGNLAEINRLADRALQKAHATGAQVIYPDFL